MKPEDTPNFWTGRFHSAFRVSSEPLAYDATPAGLSRVTVAGEVPLEAVDSAGVVLPGDSPVYVPEHYEPNYAYPLIVWLGSTRRQMQELLALTPQISTRNYVGLALDARLPASTDLSPDRLWSIAEAEGEALDRDVFETVCQTRREHHVHSERIYLAGFDAAATPALQLVLRRPEWFAGALVFGGRFPKTHCFLSRYHELRGKRILMGVGAQQPRHTVNDAVRTGRLLHAAGMDVSTRIYNSGDTASDRMLKDIDQWVMEGIYESNAV